VTGDAGNGYTAYHDCRRLAIDADAAETMSALVAGLNNTVIASCPMFAVHSGVVGWPKGIVALPASSGGGKSTLTAALLRSGFDYLSDEALVVDDSGDVVPYPKPMALSRWSADTLGLESGSAESLLTPTDLGASRYEDTGRLTDLVLAEYGHDELALRPSPRSDAVAALIGHSFNHYKDPVRAFRLATDLARETRVWRLEYDDPLEAAALISATLAP